MDGTEREGEEEGAEDPEREKVPRDGWAKDESDKEEAWHTEKARATKRGCRGGGRKYHEEMSTTTGQKKGPSSSNPSTA